MRESSPIWNAYRSWAKPRGAMEGFTRPERREFATVHVMPSARLADLYATSSDVASLPFDARTELLARIDDLTRDLPEILALPGRSVVDLCRRER